MRKSRFLFQKNEIQENEIKHLNETKDSNFQEVSDLKSNVQKANLKISELEKELEILREELQNARNNNINIKPITKHHPIINDDNEENNEKTTKKKKTECHCNCTIF